MRNSEGRYEKLEEAVAPEQLDADFCGSLPTPAFTIKGATTGAPASSAEDKGDAGVEALTGRLAGLESEPEKLTPV